MPQPNAHLTMRLTPVTSNQEPERYMSLVIEDVRSGLRIASFELVGDDLLDLLGGRQVGGVDGVPAYLIEPEHRPALGCHTFTTEHHFPMSQYNDDTVERWAKRTSGALGAANYRLSKSNQGTLRVYFTYYTKAALPAVINDLREERQATMDVAATSCAADR